MADAEADTDNEQPGMAKMPETPGMNGLSLSQETTGSNQFKNVDEALNAIGLDEETFEIDEATNNRLLKKIDLHLLPLLFLIYSLQFLDKLTLSYASIMGLKEDIHMTGSEYSWASSMFYLGYLIWEIPTSRLLQILPLGKYTGFNIIAWGVVLSCHAAATTATEILFLRFLLGVFEASVTPAFALYTSQWYTKSEQGSRTAIWFCSNGTTEIIGGFIAYAITHKYSKGEVPIRPWQMLFLATGLLTITSGILFIWYMPDNQMNTRWLGEIDKKLAIIRIRGNQQGIGNKIFKKYQLLEAVTDPLTWMFVFYSLVHSIPNGGMSGFFSQIITSFGYTPEQSLLLDTPAGVVGFAAIYMNGYFGDKLKNRILVASTGSVFAMIGMSLIVTLPLSNRGGRLAGYYITQTAPMGLVTLLSLISTNVAGYTKKTTVAGLYFVGYCVGNIIGPQTFTTKDAPRYVTAEIAIIVCWGATLIDLLVIYWYCNRQNMKKALERNEPNYIVRQNQEFFDLTDRENSEFVYTV